MDELSKNLHIFCHLHYVININLKTKLFLLLNDQYLCLQDCNHMLLLYPQIQLYFSHEKESFHLKVQKILLLGTIYLLYMNMYAFELLEETYTMEFHKLSLLPSLCF